MVGCCLVGFWFLLGFFEREDFFFVFYFRLSSFWSDPLLSFLSRAQKPGGEQEELEEKAEK